MTAGTPDDRFPSHARDARPRRALLARATFLQSGTRDLFLSNTVRMHRALCRAQVPAELHVFEAMPHGGFMGAPEDKELATEVARFVRTHWGLASNA